MKTITAIEFVRPNARQRPYEIEVSDEAAAKFELITNLGLRLTVENLNTGLFSTCIEVPDVGDIYMDLCVESKIPKSLENMLIRFNERDMVE
jgi:hypothetical protein